jgi:FdhD protein
VTAGSFEGYVPVVGGRLWAQWAGEGPGVVLAHAGIADARMWDPQWDALVTRHRVVRYDLRGFGRSEVEHVRFSNRADLVAMMDAAGLERAVLVGCSRAGAIVIDTALEFPDRVAGIVWVCGGLVGAEVEGTPEETVAMEGAEALEAAKDWAAAADADVAIWVDGIGQPPGRAPQAVREFVRRMAYETYVQEKAYGDPVQLDPPAAARLGEIRAPVLAIVGRYDESASSIIADRIVSGVRNGTRIDVDTAHLPSLERPGWFTDTLLAFLDEAGWHMDSPSLDRQASRVRTLAYRAGRVEVRDDRLAGEEPMAIRACGPGQDPVDVAVTMRTPGHEPELAAGFLWTEGLLDAPGDITDITLADPGGIARPDDEVTVHLGRPFDRTRVAERHFVATASCGICGKATLDGVAVRCAPIPDGPMVEPATLLALPGALRAAQAVFEATGGLHAAALFDPGGALVAVREDVGRHNALDKLIGGQLLAGRLPLHDRIVLVSGRASFELVQKAAVAGVPVLAAVSAPSDLAVEAAERLGVTLVGFLRGEGFNVYARPGRITVGRA